MHDPLLSVELVGLLTHQQLGSLYLHTHMRARTYTQDGKSPVDLVLSCVDNYAARMAINQVRLEQKGANASVADHGTK